jgi:hypothetical protein
VRPRPRRRRAGGLRRCAQPSDVAARGRTWSRPLGVAAQRLLAPCCPFMVRVLASATAALHAKSRPPHSRTCRSFAYPLPCLAVHAANAARGSACGEEKQRARVAVSCACARAASGCPPRSSRLFYLCLHQLPVVLHALEPEGIMRPCLANHRQQQAHGPEDAPSRHGYDRRISDVAGRAATAIKAAPRVPPPASVRLPGRCWCSPENAPCRSTEPACDPAHIMPLERSRPATMVRRASGRCRRRMAGLRAAEAARCRSGAAAGRSQHWHPAGITAAGAPRPWQEGGEAGSNAGQRSPAAGGAPELGRELSAAGGAPALRNPKL